MINVLVDDRLDVPRTVSRTLDMVHPNLGVHLAAFYPYLVRFFNVFLWSVLTICYRVLPQFC